MQINFPPKSMYDSLTMSVRFPVTVDGITKSILVSQETLQDHFGGNNNPDLVAVFEANRAVIENKARDLIEAGSEGDVIIRTNMF
jgi:hypothetical protein